MLAGKNRATPTASRLANLKVFAERIRVWAVYAALILILINLYFGGFLFPPQTYLLPAILVLVAAFVIHSIQAIEKSLAADEKPDSYPDMMAAVSALEDLIAADRDVTDLKIIAATGGTSVNLVLPGCAKRQQPNTCVSIFTSSTQAGHSAMPTPVIGSMKPPRRSTGYESSTLIRALKSKSAHTGTSPRSTVSW